MFVVGITGGIGSGKSAVTRCFEALGIAIIDADVIARNVVALGSPALQQIKQHFGESILLANGELDRAKLRQIVFADPAERRWLEQLTHPIIRENIVRALQTASSQYVILVSPLLIESGQFHLCNRILVVDVSRETQLQRTMLRDNNNRQQVEAIIEAQLPREKRLQQAHDVINNEVDLLELPGIVASLHQKYSQLSTQSLVQP